MTATKEAVSPGAEVPSPLWIDPDIKLAANYGLSPQGLAKALRLIEEHEDEIRAAWRRHFPGRGFWNREVFLSFKEFPWFRDAPVAGVLHVERPQPHHLSWPELDIDLDVESIEDPRRFPLVSRERPNPRLQRAVEPRRAKGKAATRRPRRR